MLQRLLGTTVLSIACIALVPLGFAPSASAASNDPIAQVDVGGGSLTAFVATDGDAVFIPVDVRDSVDDSVDGHVAVIDANSRTVETRIPVGVGPVRITTDARGGRLFVTNILSGTVSVINVANQRVTATIDVGGEPVYSAFVPGRSRLLVGTGPTGQLVVVDTRSNTVIDRLDLGGNVGTVVLSNDGRFAYVSNTTLDRLDVIDTSSLQVVAQVPTGAGPNRAVASPNGRLLLVSNFNADSITVIDARTFQVIREITVGERPVPAVVAPSGKWAWVASAESNTASKIDLTGIRTNANPVTRSARTGDEPWMLMLNATGSTLYVANRQSPNLTVICTRNGQTPAPLTTTDPNRWVAAGLDIYAGGASSSIDVIEAATLNRQRCR